MKVYADICTLCRPFDEQSQPRIWMETHALCVILHLAEVGEIEFVRSPFHDIEAARNTSPFRRSWIEKCLSLATHKVPLCDAIRVRAVELERVGVKSLDALHAAAAESADCRYLLTCDDRFRKRYSGPLSVLNPADFILEYFQQTQ